MTASLATHPLLVAGVWLAAYCLSTAIALENLLGGITPAPIQFYAKLMAYIGAAANAGFTLATVTLYGLACGLMLKWLGTPVTARAMARRVAAAFWVVASYAWLMVGVVATQPPPPLALDEALAAGGTSAHTATLLGGMGWLGAAQYAPMVGFPTVLFVLLARLCAWFNALIAVAFGAAAVSATGLAITRLAEFHQA